jgi:hypothetical protein
MMFALFLCGASEQAMVLSIATEPIGSIPHSSWQHPAISSSFSFSSSGNLGFKLDALHDAAIHDPVTRLEAAGIPAARMGTVPSAIAMAFGPTEGNGCPAHRLIRFKLRARPGPSG